MNIESKLKLFKYGKITAIVGLVLGAILLFMGSIAILGIIILIVSIGGLIYCLTYSHYFKKLKETADIVKGRDIRDISQIARSIGKSKKYTEEILHQCLRWEVLKGYTIVNGELYPISKKLGEKNIKASEMEVFVCKSCGAKFEGKKDEICHCPYCKTPIKK